MKPLHETVAALAVSDLDLMDELAAATVWTIAAEVRAAREVPEGCADAEAARAAHTKAAADRAARCRQRARRLAVALGLDPNDLEIPA